MKYEYIGEQSITLHGIGEAGAHMSESKLPFDAEGQDLGWHALNYRTAHTMHAQAMYEELERYVRAAILAERERCARVCDEIASTKRMHARAEADDDEHAVAQMLQWKVDGAVDCASAIRRGSV